jgi:hypothetical protein
MGRITVERPICIAAHGDERRKGCAEDKQKTRQNVNEWRLMQGGNATIL